MFLSIRKEYIYLTNKTLVGDLFSFWKYMKIKLSAGNHVLQVQRFNCWAVKPKLIGGHLVVDI